MFPKLVKEKDVLRDCLQYLELRGIYHWRQNQGAIPLRGGNFRAFVGKRGLPDIFCIVPPHGTLVAVETKRPVGGRISVHQALFRDALIGLGGKYHCVTSVEQLDQCLKSGEASGISSRGTAR